MRHCDIWNRGLSSSSPRPPPPPPGFGEEKRQRRQTSRNFYFHLRVGHWRYHQMSNHHIVSIQNSAIGDHQANNTTRITPKHYHFYDGTPTHRPYFFLFTHGYSSRDTMWISSPVKDSSFSDGLSSSSARMEIYIRLDVHCNRVFNLWVIVC